MRISNPEGNALAQAGFTTGVWFHISLYRSGLMLTRLDDDIDIAALVAELDSSDTGGADWVGDKGELTLAGNWLTQSGLLTPPFSIEAGKELLFDTVRRHRTFSQFRDCN
ncbi:hypothetical protein OHJ28_07275 [Dickeya fangzhongdai]|uniref:hypothetical protein n=1 Tax=Dickeya fangzhongdai TaxID=1778540 RepID=UPI003306C683